MAVIAEAAMVPIAAAIAETTAVAAAPIVAETAAVAAPIVAETAGIVGQTAAAASGTAAAEGSLGAATGLAADALGTAPTMATETGAITGNSFKSVGESAAKVSKDLFQNQTTGLENAPKMLEKVDPAVNEKFSKTVFDPIVNDVESGKISAHEGIQKLSEAKLPEAQEEGKPAETKSQITDEYTRQAAEARQTVAEVQQQSDANAQEVLDKPGEKPTVYTEAQQAVLEKNKEELLSKWTTEHPAPDREKDPAAFDKWAEERLNADRAADIDSQVQMWDKDNPPPANTNSKEYTEWLQKREAQKEKIGREVDEKAKKPEEMSTQEIAFKTKELIELKKISQDLNDGINALRASGRLSNKQKVQKADFVMTKLQIDLQAKTLEQELKVASKTSVNPLKKAAIQAALATAAVTAAVVLPVAAQVQGDAKPQQT